MLLRIAYRSTIGVAVIAVTLFLVVPRVRYLVTAHSQSPYCTNWTGLSDIRVQLSREDAQQQSDIYGDERAGVHSRDVVIDCGAHVGVFVRKSLSRGARLVVAVEPALHAAECLRRNFSREIKSGAVIVCQKAIWDKPGMTLKFYINGNEDAADSLIWHAKHAATVDVETTTIDAIAAEYHLDRIDFIKADIKGAAASMLRLPDGLRTLCDNSRQYFHGRDVLRVGGRLRSLKPDT